MKLDVLNEDDMHVYDNFIHLHLYDLGSVSGIGENDEVSSIEL